MEGQPARASSSKQQWCRSSLYVQMRKRWQHKQILGTNPGFLKGLNVVSERMRRYIYCRPPPPCWGHGDWPVRAEMLLPSMHLSEIRLSLGEPSRLQDLQPVDMLVMSSSVSGRSYRSVVTFSGQGRLNDILTWNKAKGCVNSKYKKYSNTKKSLLQWTSTSWCTDLKHSTFTHKSQTRVWSQVRKP